MVIAGFPQDLENRENREKIMVWEFSYFRPKSGYIFPEWLNAAIYIKKYRETIGPICISIPWNNTHDLNIDGHTTRFYGALW